MGVPVCMGRVLATLRRALQTPSLLLSPGVLLLGHSSGAWECLLWPHSPSQIEVESKPLPVGTGALSRILNAIPRSHYSETSRHHFPACKAWRLSESEAVGCSWGVVKLGYFGE